MESSALETSPAVLAVVVNHDGVTLLPEVLAALDAQTYERIEIVAVDNASTDGSRELLLSHLGTDRVLVADRDLGFTGAVSFALDSRVARSSAARWILLVHDDLILEPDAVARLVEEADRDPRLAVAGPKLVWLDDPRYLQQVGMSADLTGRADSGVDSDELDHGQRDAGGPVLYVTTAGMFIRRETFEELGRFDARYEMFREDLDLCWRAWIAGHDVAVVPRAVGRHHRSHAEDHRVGEVAAVGRHYLAERNTLATLLKCYGGLRLLYVIPLFFLVGIAKVGGFLVTRRVTDAWETLRAWAWNVRNLRSTWRLRRDVQSSRLRTDSDLRPLFIGPATRGRAYWEAITERVVGDDLGVAAPAAEPRRGLSSLARRRPGLLVAAGVVLLSLIAAVPLLGAGALRGGDLALWPADPADLIRSYLSPWVDAGGAGTSAPASPAQALLGLFGVLTFGSGWLATRLLLVGALPAAWLVALRALRLLTPGRGARLAGATLYALSPPALAALKTGRLGALVAVILLPALIAALVRTARPGGDRALAWRSAAVTAFLAAILVAFEPPLALLVLPAAVVALVAAVLVPAPGAAKVDAAVRVVVTVIGGVMLLAPWLPTLLAEGGPLRGGFSVAETASAPFVRWLLLIPEMNAFPGPAVAAAFAAAGLLGLLAAVARPGVVGATWALIVAATLAAWALDTTSAEAALWPGLPLLVTALGYGGLVAIAYDALPPTLREHSFGWRQVSATVSAVAIAVGIVGAAAHLVSHPWDAFVIETPALPAFIGAESDVTMRYRVLTLVDEDETVRWDVTDGDGPTMLGFGAPPLGALGAILGSTVDDIVSGVSPQAAARLGHANVRYVHVPEGGRTEELEAALGEQLALEPQPVEQGLVYLVRDWLPRVTYVEPPVAAALVRQERLPEEGGLLPLYREGYGRWVGEVPGRGAITIAEPASSGWTATIDGEELDPAPGFGLARFSVPGEGAVTVAFDDGNRRAVGVGVQLGVVLFLLSFALRAPRFAREEPA
jgi:GT2 family glycosyltransferase